MGIRDSVSAWLQGRADRQAAPRSQRYVEDAANWIQERSHYTDQQWAVLAEMGDHEAQARVAERAREAADERKNEINMNRERRSAAYTGAPKYSAEIRSDQDPRAADIDEERRAREAFANSPEAQEYARAADWAENGNPQEGDRPHSHSEYQWQDGKLIRDPGILSDPPWEMPDVRSSARTLSGRTPEEIVASVKAAMLEDAHESAQSRWEDQGYHSHRAQVRDDGRSRD